MSTVPYGTRPGVNVPAVRFAVVTPSDTADLPFVCRGVAIPAAGALAVVDYEGNAVTIPDGALAAGIIHPLRLQRIKATGTTVSGNILIVD